MQTDLKGYFDKAAEEKKQFGTMLEETKTKIDALQKQADALDVKLAERHAQTQPGETIEDRLKKDDTLQRIMRDKHGRAVLHFKGREIGELLERKTTITSTAVGQATSGVLQIDRIPGITPEARQQLKVRDLLPSRPTVMQVVDFVKVNAPMVPASPQVEASAKFENAVTFTSVSEKVRLIATWIPASKQILDDFTELMNFLNGSLSYYVDLEEETQLLSGDGTGENLHGLIPQATSFSTGLLSASAGWNKIDIVGRAIEQIQNAKEINPRFIVLHPTDWWGMRLQKDSFGRYILGDPQQPLVQSALFGITPVVTTSITSGTFLVGGGEPVQAEIRDRMELVIEISTEYSDYFVAPKGPSDFAQKCASKNLVNSENLRTIRTTLSEAAETRNVQRLSRKGVGNSVPEAPGTQLRLAA